MTFGIAKLALLGSVAHGDRDAGILMAEEVEGAGANSV